MMVVVTYDVNTETNSGKTRLRKVAKKCENYGVRVQNSVFECIVTPAQCRQLQADLSEIMNQDKDSLRFYYLGDKYQNKIAHIGAKKAVKVDETLILI